MTTNITNIMNSEVTIAALYPEGFPASDLRMKEGVMEETKRMISYYEIAFFNSPKKSLERKVIHKKLKKFREVAMNEHLSFCTRFWK
jgi:hypothetical protein